MLCLEKRPEDRYPTAAALADDLERFRDDQPIAAARPAGIASDGRRSGRGGGLPRPRLSAPFSPWLASPRRRP